MQVIEEFVIFMVTCRGKPSPTTPFYGLTVGTSIKKYNTKLYYIFPLYCYFCLLDENFQIRFCKKGGGGGRGGPTYRKKSCV